MRRSLIYISMSDVGIQVHQYQPNQYQTIDEFNKKKDMTY